MLLLQQLNGYCQNNYPYPKDTACSLLKTQTNGIYHGACSHYLPSQIKPILPCLFLSVHLSGVVEVILTSTTLSGGWYLLKKAMISN